MANRESRIERTFALVQLMTTKPRTNRELRDLTGESEDFIAQHFAAAMSEGLVTREYRNLETNPTSGAPAHVYTWAGA